MAAQAQFSGPGIGPGQAVPIADIVFVLDRSTSIGVSQYRRMLENVAASIGTSIPATVNHRVAVVVFHDFGVLALPFTAADHPMLPDLINGINDTFPVGGQGTNVEDGLQVGSATFSSDPSAAFMNQLVLITDKAEQCIGGTASAIRSTHQARISVGWISNPLSQCDDLQLVFDLDDYESLVNEDTRIQVQVANAKINPPYVNTFSDPRLPGILHCLPSNNASAEYAAFLDEALCPIRHSANTDRDHNLVPDVCEYVDCNNDGIPDPGDCNCNGIPDSQEDDCDGDGLPDDCEPDCDGDGIPDSCESDCDDDGIPDDCEPDCDGDGIPNDCDSEFDCDYDGIPDNCEPDCDGDGIPDDCDDDRDGDGIPDINDPIIGPCSTKDPFSGEIIPIGGGGPCGSSGGN